MRLNFKPIFIEKFKLKEFFSKLDWFTYIPKIGKVETSRQSFKLFMLRVPKDDFPQHVFNHNIKPNSFVEFCVFI